MAWAGVAGVGTELKTAAFTPPGNRPYNRLAAGGFTLHILVSTQILSTSSVCCFLQVMNLVMSVAGWLRTRKYVFITINREYNFFYL